jgi:hypothetical protein
MTIQVLGSGCPTCQKLHAMVGEIVQEEGKNDVVEYFSGEKGTGKIVELGIMRSPVLLVDEKVVMVGFIPDKSKVREKIYGHV